MIGLACSRSSWSVPPSSRCAASSSFAAWSAQQIYAYMKEHRLPFHPLWAAGYTSVGRALHTQRPVDPNEPRSGRWAGQKTECGIHDIGKPKRNTK